MPASLVQQVYASSISSSSTQVVTITTPSNNNLLVGVVHYYNSTSTSTAPTGNGTWTLAIRNTDTADTPNHVSEVWYCVVSSPSTSVTFNNTAAQRMEWAVLEFSGLATSSVLDQTASANTNNVGSYTLSCGTTSTTTAANEMVFIAVAYVTSYSSISTPPGTPWAPNSYNTGYTSLSGVLLSSGVNTITVTGLALGWKNISSTGTQTGSIQDTNLTDQSAKGAGVIVTFSQSAISSTRRRITSSFL